jgi:hypothetical protein
MRRLFGIAVFGALVAAPAHAGQPKLDKDTCTQLASEQATFIQSGILADLQRGPSWGKSNLSAERLREIEHYIVLDEQIKFACRQATLTPEMERAGEIAKKLELNSDADPFAPPADPAAKAPSEVKAEDNKTSAVPSEPKASTPAVAPEKPKSDKKAAKPAQKSLPTDAAAKPVANTKAAEGSAAKPVKNPDDVLKTPPTFVAPVPHR